MILCVFVSSVLTLPLPTEPAGRWNSVGPAPLPRPRHPIAPATQQHQAGRAPGQRVPDCARLAQGVQALPPLPIPDEELLTITASATTGQPRPIGTPGHAHDHATMPLQRSSKPAVGGVPQEDATIVAATGQARPVRTPLDTAYPGWQPTPDPPAAAFRHLPHLHPPLRAPPGQQHFIPTPHPP